MKLTLAEPKYLKDSVSIIAELVNEARFKVSKDSIELVAMDPANVAMVVFKLLSSAFTEYEAGEETEISINLGNLKQILKRAGSNDVVRLEIADSNKLKVTMTGGTTRTFHLPLIDVEEKEQKVPDLKFPVSVELPSSSLVTAVEDADIVAESLTFAVEPGEKASFVIEAEGDLNKARVELKESEDVKITSEKKEKVKARYSIEYLKKMISGSKLAEKVTARFDNDYPLKLEFKVVDRLLLEFILAPRVENE